MASNKALRYPTDCAPLTTSDGTTDKPKVVGWNECFQPDGECKKCTPDEKTSCGKMMLDSGLDLAPEGCYSKCCKNDVSLGGGSGNSSSNGLKNSVKEQYNKMMEQKWGPALMLVLWTLLVVLLTRRLSGRKQ